MQVKQISALDTHVIRQKILRQGKSLEECIFQHDDDDQTFHLGAFEEGKLVSIASFYYENNQAFADENQYRLRGMATLAEFQKRGLSSELLRVAFSLISKNFCTLLWCNARMEASGFYQKVGFEKVGETFEIEGIGPHVLMFKRIS